MCKGVVAEAARRIRESKNGYLFNYKWSSYETNPSPPRRIARVNHFNSSLFRLRVPVGHEDIHRLSSLGAREPWRHTVVSASSARFAGPAQLSQRRHTPLTMEFHCFGALRLPIKHSSPRCSLRARRSSRLATVPPPRAHFCIINIHNRFGEFRWLRSLKFKGSGYGAREASVPRLSRKRKANANDWGRFVFVSVAAYNTPYSNYLGAEGLLNKMLKQRCLEIQTCTYPSHSSGLLQ